MTKIFMKKSKKGITLVESMIAVVILGILTTGIISMLTVGGTKINQISSESANYTQAVQKLDLIVSAISNGSGVLKDEESGIRTLDIDELLEILELDEDPNLTLTAEVALHSNSQEAVDSNLRGWYLTLKYNDAVVTAFASDSKGAFDIG